MIFNRILWTFYKAIPMQCIKSYRYITFITYTIIYPAMFRQLKIRMVRIRSDAMPVRAPALPQALDGRQAPWHGRAWFLGGFLGVMGAQICPKPLVNC